MYKANKKAKSDDVEVRVTLVLSYGQSGVSNWKYEEIVQDTIDSFLFSKKDSIVDIEVIEN
jgi:hypothetical protein